jgi:hypothetical protein
MSFYNRFPTWALNFGAASIVIVIIVGILGNALTIVALTRCQRVRNVATAFIIRYLFFKDLSSFSCFGILISFTVYV